MEVLRPAHRPENQLPVINPAPVYYPQKPYRLDKRLDVLVMNPDFDFWRRFVVLQERQDSFVVKLVRVNRFYDVFIPVDEVFIFHLRDEIH